MLIYNWQSSLVGFAENVVGRADFCMISYLLTPQSVVLHGKLIDFHMVNKFPSFYGTQGFIFKLVRTCHCVLSWASWIQVTLSHPEPGSVEREIWYDV